MARDVDRTLHEVVARHGNLPAGDATAYPRRLAADNRYVRDVY